MSLSTLANYLNIKYFTKSAEATLAEINIVIPNVDLAHDAIISLKHNVNVINDIQTLIEKCSSDLDTIYYNIILMKIYELKIDKLLNLIKNFESHLNSYPILKYYFDSSFFKIYPDFKISCYESYLELKDSENQRFDLSLPDTNEIALYNKNFLSLESDIYKFSEIFSYHINFVNTLNTIEPLTNTINLSSVEEDKALILNAQTSLLNLFDKLNSLHLLKDSKCYLTSFIDVYNYDYISPLKDFLQSIDIFNFTDNNTNILIPSDFSRIPDFNKFHSLSIDKNPSPTLKNFYNSIIDYYRKLNNIFYCPNSKKTFKWTGEPNDFIDEFNKPFHPHLIIQIKSLKDLSKLSNPNNWKQIYQDYKLIFPY